MFKDYNEVAEPLVLPINGKPYTLPPVGFIDGVRLTEALEPGSEKPLTNGEFFAILLGPAYEEMQADNAPAAAVTRAAMTNLQEYQSGRAAALIYWETGGHPKALEDLVKKVLQTTRRKTRQAAASTTRRRGTGSGTKTSQQS